MLFTWREKRLRRKKKKISLPVFRMPFRCKMVMVYVQCSSWSLAEAKAHDEMLRIIHYYLLLLYKPIKLFVWMIMYHEKAFYSLFCFITVFGLFIDSIHVLEWSLNHKLIKKSYE